MSLWDAYGDSNAKAVDFMATQAPEPPKPAAKWNAWSTPQRAVANAAASSMASLTELVKGFGAAGAIAAQADPVAVATMPDAVAAGAVEGRRQLDTGEAFSTDIGRSLRAAADYYRPDPATAGKAEQTIFGLASGLTQAIGHGLTFGPAAPITFAADQALATADQLEQQGVDAPTRQAVAGAGVPINAAGFLIPIAGNTWAQTLALGGLSGPASYIAQQKITQQVLQDANYSDLAKQYDPLDPWGLAASMLPFGFGALAMRGRGARPNVQTPAEPVPLERAAPPSEVVDAAMVHNLSTQREQAIAATASPDTVAIPRADNLPTAERAIENRFAEKLARDPEAAVAEYAALPDSMGGRVLNTDVARELSPDYLADRTKSVAVHEPASWFIKQLYAQKLADIQPGEAVTFTSGGTGAGKTTAIEQVPTAALLAERSAIVYDTNMNSIGSAVAKIEQALAAGADVNILHVQRDPIEALTVGALPRAMRQAAKFGTGRTVPLVEHARTHRGAAEVIQQLADRYKDDPRVSVQVIDNTRGKGAAAASNLGFVRGFDYNGLEGKLNEALKREFEAGRISEDVFRATEGPAVPDLVGADGAGNGQGIGRGNGRASEQPAEPAAVAAARQAFADQTASGKTVDVFLADKQLPPEVENLLRGLSEAGKDTGRVERLLTDFTRASQEFSNTPAMDIAADVVEAARKGETVSGRGQGARAGSDPTAASIADRVATIENSNPDLVVRVSEDGKPVTVAEEMARIRQEAELGTDAELGKLDADLLRVAANCALSMSAA